VCDHFIRTMMMMTLMMMMMAIFRRGRVSRGFRQRAPHMSWHLRKHPRIVRMQMSKWLSDVQRPAHLPRYHS